MAGDNLKYTIYNKMLNFNQIILLIEFGIYKITISWKILNLISMIF